MINTGLLTIHRSINCGASLQASALYEILHQIGMNPRLINYCPAYFMPLTDYSNAQIRRSPKGFAKMLFMGRRLKRIVQLFQQYEGEYYPNTTVRIDNLADSDLTEYGFDYYICGSDQIWNPSHVHYDGAWLFDFVKDNNAKLVSYAASIGKDELDEKDLDWLRSGLGTFDHIGVREDSAVKIVEELGFKAIQNVDPTLLIERDEWRKREQEPCMELPPRYILHYPIEPNPIERQLLDALKRSLGIEVITMTDSIRYSAHADKCLSEYGPKQFLYMVDHAEAVLTNSFHGLVFSMIFGKKLVSFRNMSKNSRLDSLLRSSGLDGFQITDMNDFVMRDLDEEQEKLVRAYESLTVPIEDSIRFLKEIKTI